MNHSFKDNVHHITEEDLPLACPREETPLWSAHPRVYLPIEKNGEATCPYCGTQFLLKKSGKI